VDSIVEVYGTKLRYPYSSMVYSQFDARSFSRVPSRAYDTKLLKVKVPNNYNPIIKSYGTSSGSMATKVQGIAAGTATNSNTLDNGKTWSRVSSNATVEWNGEFNKDKLWTDNPAWCFYDLITNPIYGLGDYISPNQ
jgi:predicted phage tail protein